MNLTSKQIAAIQADAADKKTEGGIEHAIVRWLGYSELIIRHAGGKVPEYLAPTVAAVRAIVTAAAKRSGKSKAKATAKTK